MGDKMLMAFADGELDPHERRLVEAALATDPELRERLKRFEITREPVARAFDSILREPVPQRLVAPIHRAMPDARDEAQTVVKKSLIARGTAAFQRMLAPDLRLSFAATCSAMLLIGVVAGSLITEMASWDAGSAHDLVSVARGNLMAAGVFSQALEQVGSGKTFVRPAGMQGEISISPVLTFRDGRGRFCREYNMILPARRRFSGLACRTAEGRWRVLAQVPVVPTGPAPDHGYAIASGGENRALGVMIERLMSGDALDPGEEAILIAKQWRHR